MFTNFFQLFSLNCRHKRLSKPFSAIASKVAVNSNWTPVDTQAAGKSSHYVVCLDCGYRYDYDWQKMRVVK